MATSKCLYARKVVYVKLSSTLIIRLIIPLRRRTYCARYGSIRFGSVQFIGNKETEIYRHSFRYVVAKHGHGMFQEND